MFQVPDNLGLALLPITGERELPLLPNHTPKSYLGAKRNVPTTTDLTAAALVYCTQGSVTRTVLLFRFISYLALDFCSPFCLPKHMELNAAIPGSYP